MQPGVDYSGVVHFKWPDFPVYQRQEAGFLPTTLSVFKLKAENHILSTQTDFLQTHYKAWGVWEVSLKSTISSGLQLLQKRHEKKMSKHMLMF